MNLPQEVFQGLEEQFKKIQEGNSIPGLSFSIVEGDKIVYSNGLGYRNKEKQLPCTSDTVFAIGSTSKSVTALSILQLVERGKIKLEDPIDKYVDVKWARKYGNDNPITIHHLLSQTSGICDMGLAKILLRNIIFVDEELNKYDLSTNEAYINHINGAYEFINPPGRYSYCNTNFTLAHIIVEEITGQSYDDYVQENLFNPCEMNNSTFKEEVYKNYNNRIMGYLMHKEDKGWRPEPIDYVNPRMIWGCGGVYSSVKDLGNYMIALMNGGKFKGKEILQPNSINKLFTTNTRCTEFEEFGIKGMGSEKGDGGYAYGWFAINDFFGKKVVTHPGSVVVSSAVVIFMPDLKIGFAVLWNGGEEIFADFISVILGTVTTLLGKDPMQEFGIIKEGMRLDKLCGTYYDYIKKHPLEITREGDDLFIEWLGGELDHRPKMPFHPIDKEGNCMKYYTKTSPTGFNMAEFIFEENGKVRLLIEKHTLFKEI